jgi:glycerophosphoryl diester phosphodiesterase
VIRAIPFLVALALPSAAHAASPAVHAHRGGSVLAGVPTYPEETMPAFRNAARTLRTVLELDAKLTADGVPVALHDATLDRTTNCEGQVSDRTLAELAECRADVLGSPESGLPTAPAPEPQPIPTLAEVLALAKREGVVVNLEIKNNVNDPDYDPTAAFADRVMDVVLESGIPARQMIIQSFMPHNLEAAERRMPEAEISFLSLAGTNQLVMELAASNGWDWVSPEWPIDAAYVEDAHSRDLRVAPFTLNTEKDVREAGTIGVDALITDDPLMALRTLDTEPPKAGLKALTRRLAKVRRKRRLPLRVRASEAASVDLGVRLGRRRVGSAAARFDAAGKRRVTVRLSRRFKRAVRGRQRAKLRVVARSVDVAGNRGVTRAKIRLR